MQIHGKFAECWRSFVQSLNLACSSVFSVEVFLGTAIETSDSEIRLQNKNIYSSWNLGVLIYIKSVCHLLTDSNTLSRGFTSELRLGYTASSVR